VIFEYFITCKVAVYLKRILLIALPIKPSPYALVIKIF